MSDNPVQNKLDAQQWVKNYSDELYRYAYSKTGCQSKSEDLVQESFLSALQASSAFKGQSSERTWLFAILKNKIAEYYRKASTRYEKNASYFQTDEEDDFFAADGHWKPDMAPQTWSIATSAALENKELAMALDICVEKLPATQKDVVKMKLVEENETEIVCKELQLSASNFWVLIHRAKILLRACLEKNWLNA